MGALWECTGREGERFAQGDGHKVFEDAIHVHEKGIAGYVTRSERDGGRAEDEPGELDGRMIVGVETGVRDGRRCLCRIRKSRDLIESLGESIEAYPQRRCAQREPGQALKGGFEELDSRGGLGCGLDR